MRGTAHEMEQDRNNSIHEEVAREVQDAEHSQGGERNGRRVGSRRAFGVYGNHDPDGEGCRWGEGGREIV